MQTFLPYADYRESMRVLDPSRLGNQVYREGLTLIRGKWPNHPASKMWRGYEYSLALYCLAGLDELLLRGQDYPEHRTTFEAYLQEFPNNGEPHWLGNNDFHARHRSILLWKDPEWYSQFNWTERPIGPGINGKMPYIWPVK